MTMEEYAVAVKAKQKQFEETGDFFDFDGKNCDDFCVGWDGSSRRCECGNRRVYWAEDGTGGIYAEAW